MKQIAKLAIKGGNRYEPALSMSGRLLPTKWGHTRQGTEQAEQLRERLAAYHNCDSLGLIAPQSHSTLIYPNPSINSHFSAGFLAASSSLHLPKDLLPGHSRSRTLGGSQVAVTKQTT